MYLPEVTACLEVADTSKKNSCKFNFSLKQGEKISQVPTRRTGEDWMFYHKHSNALRMENVTQQKKKAQTLKVNLIA